MEGGDCDPNEGDFAGYTPISWAACNGHEEVVKLLLGPVFATVRGTAKSPGLDGTASCSPSRPP